MRSLVNGRRETQIRTRNNKGYIAPNECPCSLLKMSVFKRDVVGAGHSPRATSQRTSVGVARTSDLASSRLVQVLNVGVGGTSKEVSDLLPDNLWSLVANHMNCEKGIQNLGTALEISNEDFWKEQCEVRGWDSISRKVTYGDQNE